MWWLAAGGGSERVSKSDDDVWLINATDYAHAEGWPGRVDSISDKATTT